MAFAITPGYAFGVTEQVTNIKLQDLVKELTMTGVTCSQLDDTVTQGSIQIVFDEGGVVLTTGIKYDLEIPFGCNLTGWTLLADASGAIKVDIWKDTYANYPPTDADSITNGHEPEIAASGTKAQDTDIADWTTVSITKGSILRFNIDSCATITRATLSLQYTRV